MQRAEINEIRSSNARDAVLMFIMESGMRRNNSDSSPTSNCVRWKTLVYIYVDHDYICSLYTKYILLISRITT